MNLTKLKTTVVLVLFWAAGASAAKQVIQPKEFPAGRPFSPGLLVDGTLYVSGQAGQDLKTGQIPGEFEAEMRQCLDNVGLILKEGGMGFDLNPAHSRGGIGPSEVLWTGL